MSRQTIQQRIELVGGKEIEAELKALGKAGEDAGKKLKATFSSLGTTFAAFGKSLGGVHKAFNEFGAAAVTLGRNLALVAGAVAGAGIAIEAFTKKSADALDQTQKMADALGASAEGFSKLAFAAAQDNVAADDFAKAMSHLNQAIAAATTGKGSASDAVKTFDALGTQITVTNAQLLHAKDATDTTANVFQKLGLSISDLKKLKFEDQVATIADAFSKLPDGANKAAIELELFGGKFPKLNAFLNEGKAGLAALGARFDQLHGPITRAATDLADKFGDSLGEVSTAFTGIRDAIALAIEPALIRLNTSFANFLARNRERIAALAQTFIDKMVPILDDVIALLEGRDADVKNGWILQTRDAIIAFGTAVKDFVIGFVIPAFNQLAGLIGTGPAILAVVLSLTGGFTALASAFGLLASVLGVLAVLLTPEGLIIGGLLALGAAIVFVVTHWPEIAAAAEKAWEDVKQAASDAVQWIIDGVKSLGSNIWNGLVSAFNFVVGEIEAAWSGLLSFIGNIVSTIEGWIAGIISAAQQAASALAAIASAPGGPATAGGFARGGPVFGPGSGTSDSILARLSAGEFVMSARAVKHWGVNWLATMNALKDPLRGFSVGGLIDNFNASMSGLAVPRFATGGLAVAAGGGFSGRPVHLSLGNQTFVLAGPEDTVANLVKAATKERMLSIGSPPRRIAR